MAATMPLPPTAQTASHPAGFWIRVLAYVIDAVLIGIVSSFVGGGTTTQAADGGFNYNVNGVGMLIAAVYLVGCWSFLGYTAGMRLLGMHVVVAGGARPSIVQSIIRLVMLVVSFAVVFLGVIWVAFDSNKQGWHDKVAGTYVIR